MNTTTSAGTQVLTHVPWFILVGQPGELTRAVLMAAGWVINLVVAEWIIRKQHWGRAGLVADRRHAPLKGMARRSGNGQTAPVS
jgi:hypothetical protein